MLAESRVEPNDPAASSPLHVLRETADTRTGWRDDHVERK
jgi:hypothetical protein